MNRVCIIADPTNAYYSRAQELARQFNLNLNPASMTEFIYILNWNESPSLLDQDGRKLKIDFVNDKQSYQRIPRGKNEILARALGIDKGYRHVIDLSAGMGIDSVFLSRLGFQVTAVERNPILVLLLQEAQKFANESVIKNIQFTCAEANDYLQTLKVDEHICLYFDPMYPHEKNKTALPKQEMVLFRNLVGQDQDAAQVLQTALNMNYQRIVIKRPIKAEPLLPGRSHFLETKLVRLDVYLGKKGSVK